MFLLSEFDAEFLTRRRQHAHTLGSDVSAFNSDRRHIRIADRVWNYCNRETGVSKAARDDARERRERDAADGCCRDSEFFERGRVTRGPWS